MLLFFVSSGFAEVWFPDVPVPDEQDETDASDLSAAGRSQLRCGDGVGNVMMIWIPGSRAMFRDGTETRRVD